MKYTYWVIVFATFFFSSCHKEVYDPEALGRDYFIQGIPESFDWSTTSSVYLEATPCDRYSGQYNYKIEVFNQNPLTDSTAILYTVGWCTAQHPLQKNFVIPDADTLVYVCQTTPGKRKSVMAVSIHNKQIRCDFNPQNLGTTTQSLSLTSHALRTKANEATVPETYPEDAIEITKNPYTLKSNHNYVIKGNYTGAISFPHEGNCNLYVAGIWNNTVSSSTLENKTNIYVLPGGKILTTCKWSLAINSSSAFSIARGGQIGSKDNDNDDISFAFNKGNFLNEGTVYIEDIHIDSPDFSLANRGEFHMDDLTTENSVLIENADQGSFYADEVKIKNATFNNQCYAEIEELIFLSNAKVNIASGGAIKCKKLKGEDWNAFLTLHDNSMIEITDEAEIKGKMTISGGNTAFSLFKAKKLKAEGWEVAVFQNNLYVECEKNEMKNNSYVLKTPAQLTQKPMINIQPSKCSMGNDYQPEIPKYEQFPQKIVYDQNYTYASEDNYPSPGDYDLNDLVVGVDSITTYYSNDKEEVGVMTLHITLRAVGAVWQLGAAFQLDELKPEDIKKVTYSTDVPLGNFVKNNNNTEKNQEQAVIPLFDNAHQLLGCDNTHTIINTISNDPRLIYNADPVSFDVTIEFTDLVNIKNIAIEKLNYFTIVGTKVPRTEIHLPAYRHTDLSNNPKELQKVTEKYMWAIQVPGSFDYPHEWEPITNVYKKFENWVKSSGEDPEYMEWYKSPESTLLYKKP